MVDVVFVTAVYEHRSVIKYPIDTTKMQPGSKTELYHMTAMLFNILYACSQSQNSCQAASSG